MKYHNNVAIIQVRTGSKRFPKKSLKKLYKLKVIDWVIRRTKKSNLIDEIILATTKSKNDKIFKKIAKKYKIEVYFGEQNNVMKRYCQVAKKFRVKNIIRICADNPLVAPEFLDKLIRFFRKNKCDLAFNHTPKKKFKFNCIDGLGAEIFSSNLLKSNILKTKNKKNLEHVTKYFYDRSKFKIKPVPVEKIYRKKNIRLDINTKKDFELLENFIRQNNINVKTTSKKIAEALKYD